LVDIQIRFNFISALDIFKQFLISSFNILKLRTNSIIKNIISKIIIIGNLELLLDKGKNIIVAFKINETTSKNNILIVIIKEKYPLFFRIIRTTTTIFKIKTIIKNGQ
jgi:hypothetical protein